MSDKQPAGHPPTAQLSTTGIPTQLQGDKEQLSGKEPQPLKGRAQTQAEQDRVSREQLALLAKGLKTIDTFRIFSEEEIRTHLLPTCTVKSFKPVRSLSKDWPISSSAAMSKL